MYFPKENFNMVMASPWTLLLARLFGERTKARDDFGTEIILAKYKNKWYVIDYKEVK